MCGVAGEALGGGLDRTPGQIPAGAGWPAAVQQHCQLAAGRQFNM